MIPYAQIAKYHCGFYSWKDKIYTDRLDLVYDMSENYSDEPVVFTFNSHVFDKVDWTVEPDISLKELYKIRAQQLREKYDYLILSYSGGSDSHEILLTFLENNIFINEIQTVHFYNLTKNVDRTEMLNDKNLKPLLEFERAALPVLQAVKKKSPNTKINLLDASQFAIENCVQQKKYSFMGAHEKRNNSTHLIQHTPFVRTFFQHHYNNQTFKYRNAAFIRGIDKPNLKIFDNKMFFSFTDVTLHGHKLIEKNEIGNIYTIENFYWSPDVPLIPVKQSHTLKKAIEGDKSFYDLFLENQETSINHAKNDLKGLSRDQVFQRQYNRFIYHYWNDDMFFGEKDVEISGELILIEKLFGDSTHRQILSEHNKYIYKRYAKVRDRTLLSRKLVGMKYKIGDINAYWND